MKKKKLDNINRLQIKVRKPCDDGGGGSGGEYTVRLWRSEIASERCLRQRSDVSEITFDLENGSPKLSNNTGSAVCQWLGNKNPLIMGSKSCPRINICAPLSDHKREQVLQVCIS